MSLDTVVGDVESCSPSPSPILRLAHSKLSDAPFFLIDEAGWLRRHISHPATISLSQLYTLNPNRELNAKFGDARREYVVDREPVNGVRVRVSVYGNVEIAGEDPFPAPGAAVVAGGSVVNLKPVDSPTRRETGE